MRKFLCLGVWGVLTGCAAISDHENAVDDVMWSHASPPVAEQVAVMLGKAPGPALDVAPPTRGVRSDRTPSRPRSGGLVQTGTASWYGDAFHQRRTANGERFDKHALTAAHRTLPFGTRVRVTHLSSGRSVVLRINDRGPYVKGRVIDLSMAAAHRLDVARAGTARVKIEAVQDDTE